MTMAPIGSETQVVGSGTAEVTFTAAGVTGGMKLLSAMDNGIRPSVKKKLKDKAFARSVSRDDIYHGVEELGVDLEEHIAFVREALLEIAPQIGV